jgi:DNA-binding CsgD family transcriptional regulator/PAS domain-containing protein
MHVAARATASDFNRAVQACDFAVVVWELPNGVVWMANERAATLLGIPLERLPGTKHTDLVDPSSSVLGAIDALGSGAVELVSAERRLRTEHGAVPVRMWSRAIELDATRAVVSLYIPIADVRRIGRDPTSPWSDLGPLAIGTTDLEWTIESVSSDIREIVGIDPSHAAGRSMLDFVHPDDAWKLLEQRDDGRSTPRSHCSVRLRHLDGSFVDVCVLVAVVPDAASREGAAFTLLAIPHATGSGPQRRVAELELRLRHIAAEVRAARVLEDLDVAPAMSDLPQLAGLTSRQWEILSRLVRGDRVPTIAHALFVSQSTVRNHLATIYAKFDVHSQAELLNLLRSVEPA